MEQNNPVYGINLYDLNKGALAKQPKLSDKGLKEAAQLITEYVKENKNNFYILLCKELSYYTFYCSKNIIQTPANLKSSYVSKLSVGEEVLACLNDLGEVLSVNKADTNMIECWIKKDNEVFMVAFFPYDIGVVIV